MLSGSISSEERLGMLPTVIDKPEVSANSCNNVFSRGKFDGPNENSQIHMSSDQYLVSKLDFRIQCQPEEYLNLCQNKFNGDMHRISQTDAQHEIGQAEYCISPSDAVPNTDSFHCYNSTAESNKLYVLCQEPTSTYLDYNVALSDHNSQFLRSNSLHSEDKSADSLMVPVVPESRLSSSEVGGETLKNSYNQCFQEAACSSNSNDAHIDRANLEKSCSFDECTATSVGEPASSTSNAALPDTACGNDSQSNCNKDDNTAESRVAFDGSSHPIEEFLQVKVNEDGGDESSTDETEESDDKTEESKFKMCGHCGENCMNDSELTVHILSKHCQEGEQCEECGQVFESAVKLAQHQVISHLQSDQTCQECGQSYDDSIKLARHYILEHQGGVSCRKCGEAYLSKEDLDKHLPSCDYVCPRCNNKFSSEESFKLHGVHCAQRDYADDKDTQSQGSRLHVCSSCGKGFTRVTTLKLHVEAIHEGVHRHSCKVCGKGFSRSYDLRRHSKFVHEGHQMLPIHKCEECEKSFGRMGDLRRHVAAVHQGLRPHVCDECEKGFTSAVYLKLHKESVHAGLRPHVCKDCGKAFSRTTALRLHIESIHEKLFRYSCDVCGKGFTRSTDIRRHKKFVHEGHKHPALYSCGNCGKKFARLHELRKHEKFEHKAQVHVCQECGEVFKSDDFLKKHTQQEHTVKDEEEEGQ